MNKKIAVMFSVVMGAAALTVSSAKAYWNVQLPANTTLSATTTYNEASNWSGGVVDDTFIDNGAVNPGNPAFLYFTADYTTGGNANNVAGRGLHFAYGNFSVLNLVSDGTQDRTLTLGGDIWLQNAGNQTTVIGSAVANSGLKVDLGGVTRTISANAATRSIRFKNEVSNGGMTVSGAVVYFDGVTNFDKGLIVRNGNATLNDVNTIANGMTLENGIVTMSTSTITGGMTVTSGTATMSAVNTITGGVTVQNSTLTLSSTNTITGTLVVEKSNVNLNGNVANTITGGVWLKSGTIISTNNGSLGSGDITLGDTSGANDAYLRLNIDNYAQNFTVVAGNTGTATINQRAGNNVTLTGSISLGSSLRLLADSNGSFIITGGITGAGNLFIETNGSTPVNISGKALDFAGSITNRTNAGSTRNITISSVITDKVTSVTQDSTDTLVLSASNAYRGGTFIDSGTLSATAKGALGLGNVTVSDGATLMLGNIAAMDELATLNFGEAAIINLNFSGVATINSLFDLTSGIDLTSLLSDSVTYDYTALNALFANGSGNVFQGAGLLQFQLIPEPSSLALMLGGAALLLALARKKK